MKIAFFLFSEKLSRYRFSVDKPNPGVGGTQFTTIQLVLKLARHKPDWEFNLINNTPVTIESNPANIKFIQSDSSNSFLASSVSRSVDVLIATVQSLRSIDINLLQNFSSRIVLWSRHPYDDRLRYLDSLVKLAAVVSVGAYQFYSNRLLRSPTFFIQNVFNLPASFTEGSKSYPERNELVLIHLGALVYGKGFLYIAQQWPKIKKEFSNVNLHVIGGGDLYRDREQHNLVPATPAFARSILQYITIEDIEQGLVKFHGNLGEEKFDILKYANIALQNPTGATEAFPASALECMSVGLPVIASADFGMWDSMRFFPELQIQKSSQIVTRIQWLLEDKERYTKISERSKLVASTFSGHTGDILERWVILLTGIAEANLDHGKISKPEPQPKAFFHFFIRIMRRHGRMIASSTILGKIWRFLKARLLRYRIRKAT